MISVSALGCHGGSNAVVCGGHAAHDKPMYKCKACGRNSRESPQHERYTREQKGPFEGRMRSGPQRGASGASSVCHGPR